MELVISTYYVEEFKCGSCGYPMVEPYESGAIYCNNSDCDEFQNRYALPQEVKFKLEKAE